MLRHILAFLTIVAVGRAIPLASETCTHDELTPDPNNACSGTFYQCDNGVSVEKTCPASLKFNDATDQCDYESNVAACGTGNQTGETEETCTHDELTPDPKNACSGTFYQCDNGVSVEKTCPASLKFNDATDQCDYESNVAACGTGSETGETEETCTLDELSPDPNNACSGTFYQCDNGVSVEKTCPASLKFNDATDQCDYESNVAACGAGNETGETGETCTHDELTPDPNNACSGTFYQCDNGVSVEKTCPASLKFNDATDQCDYESNVAACGTGSETGEETCTHDELTPDPENACSGTFYQCDNGVSVEKACPATLKFNDATDQCDYESNVAACGTGSETGETEETCTHDELTADPENACSGTFYQCDNGVSVKKTCPAALKFNDATDQCDYESNVAACGTGSESEEETCTNDELTPDPENTCSSTFYQCDNGVSVKKTCPAGLKFNDATNQCDYESNVAACGTGSETEEDEAQQSRVCEHHVMYLKCPFRKSIKITKASYGRSNGDTCPHRLIKSTSCHSDKSEDEVKKRCDDKRRCLVWATNFIFGDPCFGTYKYLEVEYECQ